MPKQNLKMFILIFAMIINIPAPPLLKAQIHPKYSMYARLCPTAYNDKFSVIAKNALISYGWEFKFFRKNQMGLLQNFSLPIIKTLFPEKILTCFRFAVQLILMMFPVM